MHLIPIIISSTMPLAFSFYELSLLFGHAELLSNLSIKLCYSSHHSNLRFT